MNEHIIDEELINLSVVDTAGQDDFPEIRFSFYTKFQGFLLFFDISDPSAIDDFRTMYNDINDCVENDPIFVIGGLNLDLLMNSDKISFHIQQSKTFQ